MDTAVASLSICVVALIQYPNVSLVTLHLGSSSPIDCFGTTIAAVGKLLFLFLLGLMIGSFFVAFMG